MKRLHNFPSAILIIFLGLSITLTSCKKDEEEEEKKGFKVSTGTATNVGRGWATLNGTVNADNKVCTMSFEYDVSTDYNNSVSGTPPTVSGDTSKTVYANLSGLSQNTQYFFRLKAEYPGGITYGSDMSFTTTNPGSFTITFNPALEYGSVTDTEGNVYKTVTIGTQVWMAENLRVTSYNDGTVIPFIPVATMWNALSSPGYCWYNNDSLGYGALYNWYAVNSANICPAGWHVPSDEEWSLLVDHLGGESSSGGRLREAGTKHWSVPNYGATNESGFTALPAGYRSFYGIFNSIKQKGYWWSSTESSSSQAYYRALGYNYLNTDRSSAGKASGFSIRCVKDN